MGTLPLMPIDPHNRPPLYPLKFRPIYQTRVWAGNALTRFGRAATPVGTQGAGASIGESWEIADLPPGSTSAAQCVSIVANGPLAGSTLHEVIDAYGVEFLGKLHPTSQGRFPLLVKLLDAGQPLSLQVHPSPAYAGAHADAWVKHEAWYILEAQPGAFIYKGLRPGVTAEQLRREVQRTPASPEDLAALLNRVPVKAGDTHYLPSGMVHALGAGVVVLEIQSPADTTYRLYDWGRTGRELHVEQSLAAAIFGELDTRKNEKRSHVAGMFTTVSRLIYCDQFRIEKVRMAEAFEQDLPYDQPAVWYVLKGKGRIELGGEAKRISPVAFAAGDTLLVPAEMEGAKVVLEADTVWVEVTFPQALPEAVG